MDTAAEDQELMEKLRAKYATGAPGIPLDPNALVPYTEPSDQAVALSGRAGVTSTTLTATTSTAKGSQLDAAMCQSCQGSGMFIEEYNHRRLERICEKCEGRGVIISKNGVEVSESTSLAEALKQARHKPATGERGASHLAKLTARINAYEQERALLLDGLDSMEDGEGRRLKQQLVCQIDAQLGRLGATRDRQHEALYSGKTAATIGSSSSGDSEEGREVALL